MIKRRERLCEGHVGIIAERKYPGAVDVLGQEVA